MNDNNKTKGEKVKWRRKEENTNQTRIADEGKRKVGSEIFQTK